MSNQQHTELEVIIPPDVHVAAKRGFIRTTIQAYATSLSAGGLSVAMLLNIMQEPDWPVIIATIIVSILSPVLAGLVSYANILIAGIPEAYTGQQTSLHPVELDVSYIPKHSASEGNDDVAPGDTKLT